MLFLDNLTKVISNKDKFRDPQETVFFGFNAQHKPSVKNAIIFVLSYKTLSLRLIATILCLYL